MYIFKWNALAAACGHDVPDSGNPRKHDVRAGLAAKQMWWRDFRSERATCRLANHQWIHGWENYIETMCPAVTSGLVFVTSKQRNWIWCHVRDSGQARSSLTIMNMELHLLMRLKIYVHTRMTDHNYENRQEFVEITVSETLSCGLRRTSVEPVRCLGENGWCCSFFLSGEPWTLGSGNLCSLHKHK